MVKTPLEIDMEGKKKTCMSCESRTEIDGVSYCKVDGKILPRAAICPLFDRRTVRRMTSKFDYDEFVRSYDEVYLAFNANKYTEEQAEEIAKATFDNPMRTHEYRYVHYGFGKNEDGERVNGYWLFDYCPNKGGVPVIVFKEGR